MTNQTVLSLEDLEMDCPDWDLVAVVSDWFEDQGDLETATALRWLRDNGRWPTAFGILDLRKLDKKYFYACADVGCSCGRGTLKVTYHHLPYPFRRYISNWEIELSTIVGCLKQFIEVFTKMRKEGVC